MLIILNHLDFYNNIKHLISIKESKISDGKYKDMKIVVSGFRDKDIISYIENEGGILTNKKILIYLLLKIIV